MSALFWGLWPLHDHMLYLRSGLVSGRGGEVPGRSVSPSSRPLHVHWGAHRPGLALTLHPTVGIGHLPLSLGLPISTYGSLRAASQGSGRDLVRGAGSRAESGLVVRTLPWFCRHLQGRRPCSVLELILLRENQWLLQILWEERALFIKALREDGAWCPVGVHRGGFQLVTS